jgi:hypothetical protein
VQFPSVAIEFELDGETLRYEIRARMGAGSVAPSGRESNPISFYESLHAGHEIVFERNGDSVTLRQRVEPLKIGTQSSAMSAILGLLPADDELTVATKPAFGYLSNLRYYSLDEGDSPSDDAQLSTSIPFVTGTAYAKWRGQYKATGDAGSSVLMRLLYWAQEDTEALQSLRSMLGPDGLQLIDGIDHRPFNVPRRSDGGNVGAVETLHWLSFRPSGTRLDFNCSYGQLSLGTRRVLRILTYLLFDRSSVMLIEQPEDGLHQGLTKKLIAALKVNADPSQLVISSHSSALLNSLRPDEVRLVVMKDGVTSVRPLTVKELEAAVNFMNREGSLSDFLETVQEE